MKICRNLVLALVKVGNITVEAQEIFRWKKHRQYRSLFPFQRADAVLQYFLLFLAQKESTCKSSAYLFKMLQKSRKM